MARRWAELAELLDAAKRTLPVAFREDGPPLGYLFDDPVGMEEDGMGEGRWLWQQHCSVSAAGLWWHCRQSLQHHRRLASAGEVLACQVGICVLFLARRNTLPCRPQHGCAHALP